MLNHLETFFRTVRRHLSRSELLIRLFGLSHKTKPVSEPGLVLIQIDGLARPQLEAAIANGRMPFMKKLLEQERYRLNTLYPGMPSSTPAVQAEIFYGVKCAVPSFSFYDSKLQRVVRMYDPGAVQKIEDRIKSRRKPLLAGGTAYSDVYTGGAAENHFCVSYLGFSSLFKKGYPLILLLVTPMYIYSLVRTGVLLMVESVLAVFDFFRGFMEGRSFWKELTFIPSRVAICVLMRELVTIGAKIDIARGMDIIHVNFLGYDEQAHRRGPSSRFAHWTLKGIDDCVKRLWKAGHRSLRTEYDVWIYSDHGQEDTIPFQKATGMTIDNAVAKALDRTTGPHKVAGRRGMGVQLERLRLFRARHAGEAKAQSKPAKGHPDHTIVTAMGPTGHIYLVDDPPRHEKEKLAERLVEVGKIPMVFLRRDDGELDVWTDNGRYRLPDDRADILPWGEPFSEEMTKDLIDMCHHRDAGQFTICGWRPSGEILSFAQENGSHAGPARSETKGFVMLSDDAPVSDEKEYLRPLDLRATAMRFLGREKGTKGPVRRIPTQSATTLRIMTYNIHSCVGMDGRLSMRRIARVIAQYNPDVVALQEVDVGKKRTRRYDQAAWIAQHLGMDHHFHASIEEQDGDYGNCVLSRLPMRLIKAGSLPRSHKRGNAEIRTAVMVEMDCMQQKLQLINTHLGLNPSECKLQAQALLGPEWLGSSLCGDNVALCGDFNSPPRSGVCRILGRKLGDVQLGVDGRTKKTWSGRYPAVRIDHIFISDALEVQTVEVGNTQLAQIASDHRPLLAELKIS